MGLSTLKMAGLAALAASTGLFADALFDNHSDGTNQNEFEYYWYYYDDNAGMGADDRPLKAPTSTPSVIDVPYTEGPRHFKAYPTLEPDMSDSWTVKTYKFTLAEEAGDQYATMPFTFGSTWKTSWGIAQPYVGIGSMLSKEGSSLDLSAASAVRFKIRSRQNELSVNFKIQTLDIDQYSMVSAPPGNAFGYWAKMVTVTPEWSVIEVSIAELAQPGWAKAFEPMAINQATKFAWEVPKEFNLTVDKDTLDIDDIEVVGPSFSFVSPFMHTANVDKSVLPTSKVFANFETVPYNYQPDRKTYWYAYNDVEINGNSSVTYGAAQDAETGRLGIQFEDGTGTDGAGQGAALEFSLGDPIPQGDVLVQGFVGIGINLYDSANVKYWDAAAEGVTSVYFHYILDGDAKCLSLEVSDINDVGDADNPTRKDTRGSGIVNFINLPPTGSEWKAVQVLLSDLKMHDDWDGANPIALDMTKLAKIQWKVQGGKGVSGFFAIDNIYFDSNGPIPVIHSRAAKTSGFKTTLSNGKINVSLNSVAKGTVSLVNTKGMVVRTASVAKNVGFSTKALPAGTYFVKVNGFDAKGKAVAMQSVINFVK